MNIVIAQRVASSSSTVVVVVAVAISELIKEVLCKLIGYSASFEFFCYNHSGS